MPYARQHVWRYAYARRFWRWLLASNVIIYSTIYVYYTKYLILLCIYIDWKSISTPKLLSQKNVYKYIAPAQRDGTGDGKASSSLARN